MANLPRKYQKLFAGNALNNGQFGSEQLGTEAKSNDPEVLQALSAYDNGWNDAVISSEELPPLEEIQGLQYKTDYQLQYLLNQGTPEWDSQTEYFIGNTQREVGGSKIYQSITNNNIGNALTDVVHWKIWDVNVSKFNSNGEDATILNGVINYKAMLMVVDTEGGVALDYLDSIDGGNPGDIVIIKLKSITRKIIINHVTGNINLLNGKNIEMSLGRDSIALQLGRNGFWESLSRSIEKDFDSFLGTGGFQFLLSGRLEQWGSNSVTSGTTISFPIAFSSAIFNVTSSHRGILATVNVVSNPSGLSGITLYHNAGGSVVIDWRVIGI